MAPATLGRSHRLQETIRHRGAQKRVEGLRGTRQRGTNHTATHKAPRPTTSNSTDIRQKQTLPPRAGNQTGRLIQRALVNSLLQHTMKPVTVQLEQQESRSHTSLARPRTSLISGPQTTSSPAAHPGTRPPWPQRHAACNSTPRERKSSPTRHQHKDEHRGSTARRENQILRTAHLLQSCSRSRVRPPHQMRVGNIHEPQAEINVNQIPTERQIQALRRHGDTIAPLRFRHVDDDGTDEQGTPANATTDDEDYHPDEKNR